MTHHAPLSKYFNSLCYFSLSVWIKFQLKQNYESESDVRFVSKGVEDFIFVLQK